jgi:hypothetical protein
MVYIDPVLIEVADAMKLREPAGHDRSGGKSAESRPRARVRDGDGENISATVCGGWSPWLRYLLAWNKRCLLQSR